MQANLMLKRTLLAAGMAGCALASPAQQVTPAVAPEATAALERMGAHLRTLKAFEVRAATTRDELLDSGQKVQFGGSVDLKVRRPNRLRADISSERKQRQLFYDGKTVTLYGPRVNYYAVVQAPATLGELAEMLGTKYGIETPLADLFLWGTDKARPGDIKGATYLGPEKVDGTPCDQYAFRQDGVDWQVWIQKGKAPLPRKLVITSTSEPSQLQYTSVLRWRSVSQLDNNRAFSFAPPPGARRIVMQTSDGKVEPVAKK
ncbi:MAG TPA: DUF2092 domain-containing protein [Burkholderiales bacterium]|nr:DUF2092 domain-containing protein [Burkholderiales bacterium]